MTIGEKVRYMREIAGMSQSALGEKVHMTQRKVSYIENDKYEPSIEDIRAICLCFGISADYLLNLPAKLKYPKR